MSHPNDNSLDSQKAKLLDPFEPIFPMPGMWHFIFGYIFALVSFVGSLAFMIGQFKFHPGVELAIIVSASLSAAVLVILATRGWYWPAQLLKYLSFTPVVLIGMQLFAKTSIATFAYILCAFAALAFLLLNSIYCKALVNILATRRAKIIQMKQDGTYAERLNAARQRWRSGK